MIIGAHLSIKGGIEQSPQRAGEFGIHAIQIFSKNQRQWHAPELTKEDCNAFKRNLKKHRIKIVGVHGSYLINLAAKERTRKAKSRGSFIIEVKRAIALGVSSVIFHPGSHLGEGIATGITMVGRALNATLQEMGDAEVRLLIETTAGQGTNIGYSFEQVRDMIDKAGGSERIGVCYDTCHTFAAGYDIRDRESYAGTFDAFDKVIGLQRIHAVHLNDCKKGLGSRIDRHEHIGEGMIGKEGFRLILNDRRFRTIPGILETPGGELNYKKNLKILGKLVK